MLWGFHEALLWCMCDPHVLLHCSAIRHKYMSERFLGSSASSSLSSQPLPCQQSASTTVEPEEEPTVSFTSLASSRIVIHRPLSPCRPALPVRRPVEALLSGELFTPYNGVVYVVWRLEDCHWG
eukprot:1194663-Amphidinium_carterae.1